MVLKRTITVPIYNYRITVLVADTMKELKELYPNMTGEACTMEFEDCSVLGCPPELYNVAHECEHLKNNVWNFIGYKPQPDNDEVDAYLLAWLINKINGIVAQHPSFRQC